MEHEGQQTHKNKATILLLGDTVIVEDDNMICTPAATKNYQIFALGNCLINKYFAFISTFHT